MKHNPRKLRLPFKGVLFLFLISPLFCGAQALSKNLTATLTVQQSSKIKVKGFTNLVSQRGAKQIGDQVKPLKQGWQIHPWTITAIDNHEIQHQIQVQITPDKKKPQDAQKLLNALSTSISKDSNEFGITDKMNIKTLSYTKQRNVEFTKVILNNGASFRVKYIEISSVLAIPKNAILSIKSDKVDFNFHHSFAEIQLDVIGGIFEIQEVKQLIGKLNNSIIAIVKTKSAEINAYNSIIEIKQADKIAIGTDTDFGSSSLFEEITETSLNQYTLGTVGSLTVEKTTSDDFKINKVENLESLNSKFSNYEIGILGNRLAMKAKNGNLKIDAITDDFDKIIINNTVSTILADLSKNSNYTLDLPILQYTELSVPTTLRKVNDHQYLKGNGTSKIKISCNKCKIALDH